jgi:hypothetical protein
MGRQLDDRITRNWTPAIDSTLTTHFVFNVIPRFPNKVTIGHSKTARVYADPSSTTSEYARSASYFSFHRRASPSDEGRVLEALDNLPSVILGSARIMK